MSSAGPTRVAVIGAGVIGRRAARAVLLQPDMVLSGVAVRQPTFTLAPLLDLGVEPFRSGESNWPVDGPVPSGDLGALLSCSDVILDCTPRGNGETRAEIYQRHGSRVVYQGGERPQGTHDFCATVNFAAAIGSPSVRVSSCNTTALVRIISAIQALVDIEWIRVVLIRSAADEDKACKGEPNTVLTTIGPSHHAYDVQRFWPELNIASLACAAPTNQGHLLQLFLRPSQRVTALEIEGALARASRVLVLGGGRGLLSDVKLASGRKTDQFSVVVWRDSIREFGGEIMFSAGVHMEAIVVPDTVDAVRALRGWRDADSSISMTNAALRVQSGSCDIEEQPTC